MISTTQPRDVMQSLPLTLPNYMLFVRSVHLTSHIPSLRISKCIYISLLPNKSLCLRLPTPLCEISRVSKCATKVMQHHRMRIIGFQTPHMSNSGRKPSNRQNEDIADLLSSAGNREHLHLRFRNPCELHPAPLLHIRPRFCSLSSLCLTVHPPENTIRP